MKITIENGKTIISTGVKAGQPKNKIGVKGLTYRDRCKCYTLAISYNHKKYHIGNYDTMEEGKSIREIADSHIADGSFLDWLEEYKSERKERKGSRRLKENRNN